MLQKNIDQGLIQKIEEIASYLGKLVRHEKKIALATTKGIELIRLEDVIRLESHNNYTTFHLSDKTKKVVSQSIGQFEVSLREYHFYRIHQSHVINIYHLKSFSKADGGKVHMDDGSIIEVSRRKKDQFVTYLSEQCI